VSTSQNPSQNSFGGVNPIFRVENVAVSIDYYIRKLGFTLLWRTPLFACVSRDRCSIFLSQGDQGHPGAWVWIGVNDADAIHQEFLRSGAKIRHVPTNYQWAYELQAEDLDGNILRIGSDNKADQPIGEWLDMHGQRWIHSGDSNWCRIEK
jgi:hypothetical protein